MAEARIGLPEFDVCLYWSGRYADDPETRWSRERMVELFREGLGRAWSAATGLEMVPRAPQVH
jgi:hypothetical protein